MSDKLQFVVGPKTLVADKLKFIGRLPYSIVPIAISASKCHVLPEVLSSAGTFRMLKLGATTES